MTKFNLNLSTTMYRALEIMAEWFNWSMADSIREAVGFFYWAAQEYRAGHVLLIESHATGARTQLVIPSLERLKAIDGIQVPGPAGLVVGDVDAAGTS
jgi:hypothetical protein